MKKTEYTQIEKLKKEYKRNTLKSLIYIFIFLLLFIVFIVLIIICFIRKESITRVQLTYILSIGTIDLILISLLLLLKGKTINSSLIKIDTYYEFMKMSNTKRIKHKSVSDGEFITNLSRNISNMKFDITKVDLSDEIIFEAHKSTWLNTQSYNIYVYKIEDISIDTIENVIRNVFKKSVSFLKVSITYIFFVSKWFGENEIEYLNSSYKLNQFNNKYIIPIGIDLSTEDVYFKKVTLIYKTPKKNQINFMFYKLFNEHTEFSNHYIIYLLSVIFYYISMIVTLLYLVPLLNSFSIQKLVTTGIMVFIGAIFAGISSLDLIKNRCIVKK